MDVEVQAFKDSAIKLGTVTVSSRKNIEDAVADLTAKKEAAHKVIDKTYEDLIAQVLKDSVPTNTK
jgi:hypothetical protein